MVNLQFKHASVNYLQLVNYITVVCGSCSRGEAEEKDNYLKKHRESMSLQYACVIFRCNMAFESFILTEFLSS